MRSFVLLAALAACGRLEFDGTARGDARFGDAIDARVLGPWSTPVQLPFNEINQDDDPTLTADGLELMFNSGAPRPGFLAGGDIYVTTRATTSDPWTTPVIVPMVSTLQDETCPELSADGLTLYFGAIRGSGDRDLFVVTRATRTSPWSVETKVSVSDANAEATAAVAQGGLALYHDSDKLGTFDLFVATRASTADAWTGDTLLAELSDPSANEGEHWVSEDGLMIVFGSDRAGSQGLAIWQATRASVQEPFGAPTLVDELDSAGLDTDPFVTPDLRTIYFASDRDGDVDLYMATR